MKKTILSLALAAVSIFSFNAFAGSDEPKMKPNPYQGLTLTTQQQSELNKLDESRRAENKQRMEAKKADRKAEKDADRVARRAEKRKYLESVKSIVGPDQYVIFLENTYINGPMKPKHFKGDKKRGHDVKKCGEKAGKDKKFDGKNGGKSESKESGRR